MQFIDAIWEFKNTGKHTCELVFEAGDDFYSYPAELINNQYEFSVAKVPAGNLGLIHKLEEEGYRYLENQLLIEFDVSQVSSLYEEWSSQLAAFSCDVVEEEELMEKILDEIENNMFETDRYSLDPLMGGKVSSVRYRNWLRSLLDHGTTDIYIMKRNNVDVGFFTIKQETERLSTCPIAGIFSDYKNRGYFLALAFLWLKASSERGYKRLSTSISTNNTSIHSFLSKVFSFKVKTTYVVLRKVINKNKIENINSYSGFPGR